jgi:hypothetical protein
VYAFIENELSSNETSNADKEALRAAVVQKLKDLVAVDAGLAAKLILRNFQKDHAKILSSLDSHPQLQFAYLHAVLNKEQQKILGMNEVMEQSGVVVTPELQELYIRLMTKFQPGRVYSYLKEHDNYPLDSCLRLCREANIVDATAYLLERTGDVLGALTMFLKVGISLMDECHVLSLIILFCF